MAKKNPPADAAERIRRWAAEGATIVGMARLLGTTANVFYRWLDENDKLQAALDEGREEEHKVLHNALFTAAQKGNVTAAIFLLKCRHGYREGDQAAMANKVSVTFQIPGALTVEQFRAKVIEPDKPALPEPAHG